MRRRALGLTQKQLADLCGFPYQIISRVEKGYQDLYAQRLALIAKHLNVSADYLLGLSESVETPRRRTRRTEEAEQGELLPADAA
jgi:transcriptional regulator with XRE-family HTH domain